MTSRCRIKQFVPFICFNCGEKLLLHTFPKLYCSVGCSQEAALVRYVRRWIKDRRLKHPDVREAIEIRLAHVVAGGYQEQERLIPPDVRKAVIARLWRNAGKRSTRRQAIVAVNRKSNR
jgi:hypothetical protein